MPTAFNVFLNGISGVFAGMAVLYIAMKILSLAGDPPPPGDSNKPEALETKV